jgi:peptidoglycan hydrolase-like protein with peptidoglycan-binding domain
VMPSLPPSVFTPPTVKPPTSSPPTSSPPTATSPGTRVLKAQTPMMQGKDVLQVQKLLQAHGFSPGTIDGVYGPKSVAAVLNFQRARKLTADGQVGPATLAALNARPPMSPSVPVPSTPVPSTPKPAAPATSSPAAVAPPPATKRTLKAQTPMMQGSDVLWVQNRLQALGFSPGTIDGVYGPKSTAAVRAFQTARKLVVDGIVGSNTYAALQSSAAVGADVWISGFGLDLTVPPSLRSSTPLPGAVPAMMPRATHTPLQRAATLMVQNLTVNPAHGEEDRALVKQFQAMNPGLNPTGLYGPGTAEALITQRTGHIPPTPRYWPKNASKADRAEYRALLLAQAKLDPQRAEEWEQAANRVF